MHQEEPAITLKPQIASINSSPYFEFKQLNNPKDLKNDSKESPRSTSGFEGHCAAPMNRDSSDIVLQFDDM